MGVRVLLAALALAVLLATLHTAYAESMEAGAYPPLVLAKTTRGYMPLLLVPQPSGVVKYSVYTGLLVNGVDITKLSDKELQDILARGQVNVTARGRYIEIYYTRPNAPLLMVKPVRYNAALFADAPQKLGLRRENGLLIAAGQPWIQLPPLIRGGETVVAVYRATSKGILFEAEYVVNDDQLAAQAATQHPAIASSPPAQPTLQAVRATVQPAALWNGGGSTATGWLSDLVPWDTTRPSQGTLGRLIEKGWLHVRGYYWSRSDTFTVPPRTTRYEVWVIITPRRSINALLEVYINGVRSLVDTLRLDPVHVYKAGVIVHTNPEQPGKYLQGRVRVEIRLTSFSGSMDLDLSSRVYTRSYVGSNDPLLYTTQLQVYGQAFDYASNPPSSLKIYLPSAGELTMFLPIAPPVLDDKGGSLVLTLHGTPPTDKRVQVYLGNTLVCDGYSWYNSWKQLHEYICVVPSSTLRSQLTEFMKTGQALPVKVKVWGVTSNMEWWIEPFTLAYTTRPRAALEVFSPNYMGITPSREASSYPVNDKGNYRYIAYMPNYITQVSHHPGEGYSAVYASTLAAAPVKIIVERPEEEDSAVTRLELYIDAVGMERVPSYYGSGILGLASASPQSVKGTLIIEPLSASGRACIAGVYADTVKKLGGGDVDPTAERVVNILGWVLGAASLVTGGATAKLAGIAAQILGLPSLFYTGDKVTVDINSYGIGTCIRRAVVNYKVETGWKYSTARSLGIHMLLEVAPPEAASPSGYLENAWPKGIALRITHHVDVAILDYGHFEGPADDGRPTLFSSDWTVVVPGLPKN